MIDLLQTVASEAKSKGLRFLLIGGHSLAFYDYPRNTLDVDLLVLEDQIADWEELLVDLGYRKFHQIEAFAQFEGPRRIPIDLMIVTQSTWDKLASAAQERSLGNCEIQLPSPEHLVAMKLHSAVSPHRSKAEQDWEDIRQLMRTQRLSLDDPAFLELVLRYGGETGLDRIRGFSNE